MSAYESLASFYDDLMPAQAYEAWAEACRGLFPPDRCPMVLDLACGTGRLSRLLAAAGYEVIGADASEEMLMEARMQPVSPEAAVSPFYIQQRMEELDLYGTVGAVVCSMDGMNYLQPEALKETLRRVRLFLEPGGFFLFDVHAPIHFERIAGQTFRSESEDAFCVWDADCSEDRTVCRYEMNLFLRKGRLWKREQEEHLEYLHTPEFLRKELAEHGFSSVSIHGGLPLREPEPEEERLFFLCRG